jgi:hypothetical protein
LKTTAFSDVFITPFTRKVYEDGNLQKWADKGLYSCSRVVSILRVKMGLFWGCHVTLPQLLFAVVLFATLWLFPAYNY